MGVPGRVRIFQAEFGGEHPSHRVALVAQSGQCSARSAELEYFSFRKTRVDTSPPASNRRQPACGFEAERDGRGGLQERPSEHHRVRVLGSKLAQSIDQSRMVGRENRPGASKKQYERRVGNVLAGCAPVYEPCGVRIVGTHSFRECLYDGDGGRTGTQSFVRQNGGVKIFSDGCFSDGVRGCLWNYTLACFRARERRFEIQHGLQDLLIGEKHSPVLLSWQDCRSIAPASRFRRIRFRARRKDGCRMTKPTASQNLGAPAKYRGGPRGSSPEPGRADSPGSPEK